MNIGPLIGVAIGVAINAIIGKRAKKAAEKLSDEDKSLLGEHFTVSQPGVRLTASIILVIMFCGGGLLFLLFTFGEIIGYYRSVKTVSDAVIPLLIFLIAFFPLILLSIWCLLRAINWKVEVYDDRIVYTSFTGKKTEFTFKDITGVKTYATQTGEAVKVYVGGKKLFATDPACKNYYVLLSRLKSEVAHFHT